MSSGAFLDDVHSRLYLLEREVASLNLFLFITNPRINTSSVAYDQTNIDIQINEEKTVEL